MFGETRSGGDEEESLAEGESGMIAKVSVYNNNMKHMYTLLNGSATYQI